MVKLEQLTPSELKAMAEGIMQVFNAYSTVADKDLRLNRVAFSSNRKTGIEVFASDSAGNGLGVVKVTLNQARPGSGMNGYPIKTA